MMKALYEKYCSAALKLILIVVIFFVIYFSITYLLPFLAPFVIAIIIALINEPAIGFLEKRFKMPRKFAAVISLLITITVFSVLLTLGILKVYNELSDLSKNISNYIKDVSGHLTELYNRANTYYSNLPANITDSINSGLQSIASDIPTKVQSLVTYLTSTIISIPKGIVFIIVTLLSAYFISSDRAKIREFIYRQMPEGWSKNLVGIKNDTFVVLFGYLKALLILMFLTFLEVTIGLSLLNIKYALVMGLIVALSDAIPILGTSLVMVPWIFWNLATGDPKLAGWLFVIYVVGVIFRQVMEPKIVGDHIGLHPLVTLIAMYIGLSLFGILGMFIGPVSVIIVKNLQNAGVIKIWNE